MLFQKSSSSSSSSSDSNEEFHQVIDDLVNNHLPSKLYRTTPPRNQHNNTNAHVLVQTNRNHEQGHNQLFNDYFADSPVYNESQFRRRFRMKRPLFCKIVNKIMENDEFFQQRRNAAGKLGLSGLQKCTASMRMLAYGVAPDAVDEYLRMGETTARKCLKKFCEGVIQEFEGEYLRSPTDEDLRKILYRNDQRGFPGMIGSIDCMHWEWKNCPNAWKGQYCGRNKNATLILEAVADEDLWIWHSFFGIPGSCNDLNVLYRSPVFTDVLQGRAPPVKFNVNGHEYNMAYYLADGIYPSWATFVKGFTNPQTHKHMLFAERQAAARKDVERAFGVLQARFAIVRQPALAYDEDVLADIMKACIIIHNMIVEDERDTYKNAEVTRRYYETDRPMSRLGGEASTSGTVNNDETFQFQTGRPIDINKYLEIRDAMRNRRTHQSLKDDLIEHIWEKYGDNNP